MITITMIRDLLSQVCNSKTRKSRSGKSWCHLFVDLANIQPLLWLERVLVRQWNGRMEVLPSKQEFEMVFDWQTNPAILLNIRIHFDTTHNRF